MTKSNSGFLPTALATLMLSTSPVLASSASWLRLGAETSRPYGHVEYCTRHAADCGVRKHRRNLPPARLAILSKVNIAVNRAIKPVSDESQHGQLEVWTVGATAGDCEDYALEKRSQLLRLGYEPQNLLLAMTHTGIEYHTVLVVRSRAGDFILDNLTDAVVPVSASSLEFIKVQSPDYGGNWLKVTGRTLTAPQTTRL